MKLLQLLFLIIGFQFTGVSQSIHQQQLEYYNSLGNATAEHYESLPNENLINRQKADCNLNKIAYGWHPYWVGSAYENYQWDLLSHFSFFSYEVNPNDGEPYSTHGWSTSAAVDAALASGNTKVTLCVTLFNSHTTFFGSATAQQTLIDNLINLVSTRGADGVNIDFEGLPSGETANFANFMVDLANQMHTAIPNSEVSTVLYSVDWNNVFDFSVMEPEVDQYIIMGYGYYYSGSSNAGPTDPLYHFGSAYNFNLSKSITSYLDDGCPRNKLVMGLPFYGYEWPTTTTSIPSSTEGSGTARTYAYVRNNTSGNYSATNYQYDDDSFTDAYVFDDAGQPTQCFIALENSFEERLKHINRTGIAGMGIWALGYDNGYTELWQAMENQLTDCREDACTGEIFDFGGPNKNYYDDENYTWTIAPLNASSIDIAFDAFDVELNFDYLYIYDGDSDASPQIAGSPFTGTTLPGTFTTSAGAVTFKFVSDGATVTPGFYATYSCNEVLPPMSNFYAETLEICTGDSILLVNTSTDATSYNWTTDNGTLTSSTDTNTYLIPTASGVHSVSLNATNTVGTADTTLNLDITVETPPNASASADTNYVNLPNAIVNFTNTSSNASNYVWNFGDGTSSTDENPWHEYLSTGIYEVELIAMGNVCDNDTAYMTIEVGSLGLQSNTLDGVKVMPNPFLEELKIVSATKMDEVSLWNTNGQLIAAFKERNSLTFQTSHLAKGVYFVHIQTGGEVQLVKVVK